jgi:hypothetical protein
MQILWKKRDEEEVKSEHGRGRRFYRKREISVAYPSIWEGRAGISIMFLSLLVGVMAFEDPEALMLH